MNKISFSFLRALALSLSFLLTTACGAGGITGGSGAETQASLPISEDAGFTISSPNAQGLVTVIGANDAVPAGATIIADVNAATSFNLAPLKKLANLLIPSASASDCASALEGLSECPDVNDEGKCYSVANAAGASSFQIPAGVGDRVTITYLDPDSCVETEVFEGAEIDDDTPQLSMFAIDSSFDRENGVLYAIGLRLTDEDDSQVLNYVFNTVNASTREVTESVFEPDDSLIGFPSEVQYFGTQEGDGYVVLDGSDGIAIAKVPDTATGTVAATEYVILSSTSNLDFLSSHDFVAAASGSACTLSAINDAYTRVFYTDGPDIYFQEFMGDLESTEDTLETRDDDGELVSIEPIRVTLSVHDPDSEITHSVASVAHFMQAGDAFNLVLKIGTEESTFYFFRIPISDVSTSLCAGILSLSIDDDAQFLEHFPDSEDTSYFSTDLAHDNGDTRSYLGIFNPELQMIKLLDRDSPTCCDSTQMAYDEASSTMSVMQVSAVGEEDEGDSFVFPDFSGAIKRAVPVANGATGTDELFFLADSFGGSKFFFDPLAQDTSAFATGNPFLTLLPLEVFYNPGTSELVTVDLGLSDSAGVSSFVRFFPVNDPVSGE